MGMMQRNEFDLAAVPFSYKISRYTLDCAFCYPYICSNCRFDYIDYIFPAGLYRLGLVIRNPHLEDLSFLTFKKVLRNESWAILVAVAFALAILLSCKTCFESIGSI